MQQPTERHEWRAMRPADMPAVIDVAARVHPGYPERDEVLAERLHLCPEGCCVLEAGDGVAGYALSHPWKGDPPPLDTLFGALPAEPDTWYVHDVAILPALRGSGAGAEIAAHLAEQTRKRRLPRLALIAVNRSTSFWERQGFRVEQGPGGAAKLASYGADAAFMVREL